MYRYLKTLQAVYECPKALQSDFARANAFYIAEAASRGHITSIVFGEPTNIWYVTPRGLVFLSENMEVKQDEADLSSGR